MAFDSLSEKLQNVFRNLRSKGRLTEDDVKTALKEVKLALLEADVNFKVVKNFTKEVQAQAIGSDVMNGLNPGQMVIKIVHDEMVKMMGSETTELVLKPGSELTVIMMAGLQGAGKTTTTAKIAGKLKQKGKKPLLAACDVYRPAAIEQLQINGEKQGVEVFSMGDKNSPVNIAKAAAEHASRHGYNVLILDTAGRLHVDETMMEELAQIKREIAVTQTILVVDAMTGQDAVNVAESFNSKLDIIFKPDIIHHGELSAGRGKNQIASIGGILALGLSTVRAQRQVVVLAGINCRAGAGVGDGDRLAGRAGGASESGHQPKRPEGADRRGQRPQLGNCGIAFNEHRVDC